MEAPAPTSTRVATFPNPVSWWIVLFGVLLPAFTLGYEVTTGFCAEYLFDPVPTISHVLLVALVPAVFLLVRFADSQHLAAVRPLLPALVGGALVVCLVYSAPFVPWLVIAVMAVMIYGLGLLPLSPLLALVAGVTVARRLRRDPRWCDRFGWRLGGGMASALLLFIAADAPAIVTHIGLEMANASAPGIQRSGVRLLRAWGDDEEMRRACFAPLRVGRPASRSVLLLFRGGIEAAEARQVYYRVTGRPWNADPPPEDVKLSNRQRWVWDADQGGEVVGQRLAGLSLASSEIAGSIDDHGALAYLEWTLVLRNIAPAQAEARAEVALPAGAVVSRVTLWVDGEPREAAFGGRGQVREAYESVVRTRRDPLLVTTSGRDRVLVQCFPVPPQGGEMKIRLGITLPLERIAPAEDPAVKGFHLPALADHNFDVSEQLVHTVELASEAPWRLRRRGAEAPGVTSPLRLTDAELSDFATYVELWRETWPETSPQRGANGMWWSRDPAATEEFVLATIAADPGEAVHKLFVVIDGSSGMEPYRDQLSGLMRRLDGLEPPPTVLLASGDVRGSSARPWSGPQAPAGAAAVWLDGLKLVGGQDNAATLRHAWEMAAGVPGAAVLWITAPQPVDLGADTMPFASAPGGGTRLFVLPVRPGPHWLLSGFDTSPAVHLLARYGTLGQALAGIPGLGGGPVHRLVYERRTGEPPAGAIETSPHLARLWAAAEVHRLSAATGSKARAEALQLALRYQLVTPVSGAVVLETQEQYRQAGLEPVPPGTVPTIPEPATIALLAVALLTLLAAMRGRWSIPGAFGRGAAG